MQFSNEQWDSVRVLPPHEHSYPVQLEAISTPAGLEACRDSFETLQRLQPPLQTGPSPWYARICYWTPEQLQQLCTEKPTLMYRHAGIGRDKVKWQAMIALLQQQRPPGAEPPGEGKGCGSSGRHQQQQQQQQQQQGAAPAAAAAALAAAADGGVLRNVLLLHVAGRKNDKSIYMLLVPLVDGESGQCLLWAYFFVYRFEALGDLMYMEAHQHIAPLQLLDVQRALKARRTQDRAWQSCIEYQQQNPQLENGLPAWTGGTTTLQPHLSQAPPCGLFDFVDRCYMQRSDDDHTAAGRGTSGSGRGGPDDDGLLEDACACRHAAAGAEQLLPLRVGSYEQFVAPCNCPKDMWCGGAAKRVQLAKLWAGELAPKLEVRQCACKGKGLGLFAGEDMCDGTLVAEYCGELVPTKEAKPRELLYQRQGLHYIFCEEGYHALPPDLVLSIEAAKKEKQQQQQQKQRHGRRQQQQQAQGGGSGRTAGRGGSGAPGRPFKVRALAPAAELPPRKYMIDATFVGGVARFANHSCDPNCRISKVCNGKSQEGEPLLLVLLETLRDVKAGEELTFDYCPSKPWKGPGPMPGLLKCECGAANCRGVVFPKR